MLRTLRLTTAAHTTAAVGLPVSVVALTVSVTGSPGRNCDLFGVAVSFKASVGRRNTSRSARGVRSVRPSPPASSANTVIRVTPPSGLAPGSRVTSVVRPGGSTARAWATARPRVYAPTSTGCGFAPAWPSVTRIGSPGLVAASRACSTTPVGLVAGSVNAPVAPAGWLTFTVYVLPGCGVNVNSPRPRLAPGRSASRRVATGLTSRSPSCSTPTTSAGRPAAVVARK